MDKQQQQSDSAELARAERIAAAKARTAAAATELTALEEAIERVREVERAETEAEQTELAVKFTKAFGYRGVGWDFVPVYDTVVAVRYPHPTTWQEYRDEGHPEDTTGMEKFVFGHDGAGSCLLYPERREFVKHTKLPGKTGLLDATRVVALKLAYVKSDEREKK
jgi:hypothetical protein